MDKLQAEQLCRVLVERCIGIRPGEVSLIVTSPAQSSQVSKELFRSLTARGSRAMMLFVPEVLLTEDRLPSAVATSMKQAHASIIYTQRMFPISTRDAALQAGARIISISGMTDKMLLRATGVDYEQLEDQVLEAARRLSEGSDWTLRSGSGTELSFALDQIPYKTFTGIARHPGDWTELPAGGINAVVAPGSANGKIVIDGSVAGFGLVHSPITVTISNGEVINISGGDEAEALRARFAKGDENARLVSEVGFGFNPELSVSGDIKEDQRAAGVAQLGFGRNSHLGGSTHSNVHLDVCLRNCQLFSGQSRVLPIGQ